ncbi:MAG: fasciclin domain-containing protein [Planctomycetota bacterium]
MSVFRVFKLVFVLLAVLAGTSERLTADEGMQNLASENARSLRQKRLDRKSLRERINHRLAGDNESAMSANQISDPKASIAAEFSRRPELAAMNQLLTEADLAEQFQLEGMAATVFVPTTELLERACNNHADSRALENLLKYHIVYGNLTDEWFENGETVVTQRKLADESSEVGVSLDDKGGKQVNGLPIVRVIEATNGRICFVNGILDPASAPTEEPADFATLLRSREGYQLMAKVMETQLVRQALAKSKAVTVLAAPDKTLSNVKGGIEGQAEFALEQLVVPGRFSSDRLAKRSTRWLLPLRDGGPTRGWAVRSSPSESGFKLFQIGPEGLAATEVIVVEQDIETDGGLLHLLDGMPRSPSMTRGGLLEQNVCRDILRSALERCEIREARGEMDSAIEILKTVLEGQAAATYATASICKSYLESDLGDEEVPDLVPAHVFTILNAGFIRGLSLESQDTAAIYRSYKTAVELAQAMLEPEIVAGNKQNTALKTLRERLNSYREAIDLARFTLRLQGFPDKVWLGDRDLFLK